MVQLRWKEPVAYKRAVARQHGLPGSFNVWRPLPFMLGIMAVGLAGAAFHNKPAFGSWPLTVALLAGVGFLVAYGLPILAALDANLIVISHRGVGRRVMYGAGVRLECWPWEEVASCSLESVTLDGRPYQVLRVHSSEGSSATFGLAPNVDVARLQAALAANGQQLRT